MSKDEAEAELAVLGFTNFKSLFDGSDCCVRCKIPNTIGLTTIDGYSTDAIMDYIVIHSYSGRQPEDVYKEFIDYAIIIKQSIRQV